MPAFPYVSRLCEHIGLELLLLPGESAGRARRRVIWERWYAD
ncbi:hypothetical protein ACFXKC_27525 [Streptomyces sp. NPDC059340]